jgi:hypothetical protein
MIDVLAPESDAVNGFYYFKTLLEASACYLTCMKIRYLYK